MEESEREKDKRKKRGGTLKILAETTVRKRGRKKL